MWSGNALCSLVNFHRGCLYPSIAWCQWYSRKLIGDTSQQIPKLSMWVKQSWKPPHFLKNLDTSLSKIWDDLGILFMSVLPCFTYKIKNNHHGTPRILAALPAVPSPGWVWLAPPGWRDALGSWALELLDRRTAGSPGGWSWGDFPRRIWLK